MYNVHVCTSVQEAWEEIWNLLKIRQSTPPPPSKECSSSYVLTKGGNFTKLITLISGVVTSSSPSTINLLYRNIAEEYLSLPSSKNGTWHEPVLPVFNIRYRQFNHSWLRPQRNEVVCNMAALKNPSTKLPHLSTLMPAYMLCIDRAYMTEED